MISSHLRGALLLLLIILAFVRPVAALHDSDVLFDPGICGSGENVVFTLFVSNTGESVIEVRVTPPHNFENFLEVTTPSGWIFTVSGDEIVYSAGENVGVDNGASEEFEFQATSPIVSSAEITDNWLVATVDNSTYVENHYFEVKVDNLSPSISATTSPSPAPAGNVWLVITASEPLGSLENVYLAVENSEIENQSERENWQNLIRVQGPISMMTSDLVVWKGVISISENFEDNKPRVLVLGVEDLAGNELEDVFVQELQVDTRPPDFVVLPEFPDETGQSKLKISGVVGDLVGGELVAKGGLSVRVNTNYEFLVLNSDDNGGFETEVELTVGSNLVGLSVTDEAGNSSSENLQMVVMDNDPPVIQDYKLVKDGETITSENGVEINEAKPEIWVNVYDFWTGVRAVGMGLLRENDENVPLSVSFENNLLKGVLEENLSPGSYRVVVTASDGLTTFINSTTMWWVFSFGTSPTAAEAPAPTSTGIVLPPPEELPVSGFPPPENLEIKGGDSGDEFSVSLQEYADPVEELKVYFTENRENVALGVETSAQPPEGVEIPENLAVYSYIRISANISDEVVKEVEILFSVEKEWAGRELEGPVGLYYWDGSEWRSSNVTQRSDNETHLVYSASVSGLSPLMVGGTPKEVTAGGEVAPQGFRVDLVVAALVVALLVGLLVGRRR